MLKLQKKKFFLIIPIYLLLLFLCPSKYEIKSINSGRIPLLNAKTSRGVMIAVMPFARKLSLPTELLMKFMIGQSQSTNVKGVTNTTHTRNSMNKRSHDLTPEQNSSFYIFSQIMSLLAGALLTFHFRTFVDALYSGVNLVMQRNLNQLASVTLLTQRFETNATNPNPQFSRDFYFLSSFMSLRRICILFL